MVAITRLQTRASCRVSSVEGWKLLTRAVSVAPAELARLRSVACRGYTVFNPDNRRVQSTLRRGDPFVDRVLGVLKGLTAGRRVGPAVAMHSYPGCQRQPMHTDFDADDCKSATTKPLGVLVALQDETRLDTPRGGIAMSQGDVLVFYGDVVHAGAAYAQDNTRVHLYFDSPDVPRAHNVTYLTE